MIEQGTTESSKALAFAQDINVRRATLTSSLDAAFAELVGEVSALVSAVKVLQHYHRLTVTVEGKRPGQCLDVDG
jgi:hypothetical protein